MIAYDTNILIYALEGGSPWSTAAQEVVNRGERDGAVISILAWQELVTGAVLQNPESGETVRRVLRDFSTTKFVPVTQDIADRATRLTQKHGKQLYGYDAIHVATAIEQGAEAFVTNDKKLLALTVEGLLIRGL